GVPLNRYPITAEQVVAEEAIYLLSTTLQQVAREGTAKDLARRLPDLNIAGKTGTTDDLKDSWFAGFSANYNAVVWLGTDDNRPTKLTGASGAMQVWADIIGQIEYQPLRLIEPGGVVWAKDGWFASCVPFFEDHIPESYSECD
ncbi:MAG: penicillin-binding transpeptidase domain-containing protein, partial [Kangiellaceae bacterium]|nr:penicillin-binding transpeptidase domain-containing protein [Kangiellaceae bacterium]